MASMSFMGPLSLSRWQSNWPVLFASRLLSVQEFRLEKKLTLRAVSRKAVEKSQVKASSGEETSNARKETAKTTRRASRRTTRKVTPDAPVDSNMSEVGGAEKQVSSDTEQHDTNVGSGEELKKALRKGRARKKASSGPLEESVLSLAVSDTESDVTSDTEQDTYIVGASGEEPKKTSRKRPTSKKVSSETPVDGNISEAVSDTESDINDAEQGSMMVVTSGAEPKKASRKSQKKAILSDEEGETNEKKASRRTRTRRKINTLGVESGTEDVSDNVKPNLTEDREQKQLLGQHEEDDISFTYAWPPLICCFGAAQYAFLPSGRPANRVIDHGMHELKKDMLWAPSKFVRAPGGPSLNVALILASLGARVEFMGKIGDDEYGQTLLYHLNVNGVQTRSIKIDKSKSTGLSYMKISRRGDLKATTSKSSAEDRLLSSEINIDILKEAKMFYFNSSSLLDQNMRSTTLQAIGISKNFGGSIFFDLNLPLPLWKSSEETKAFIREAWVQADFIEVTKQELEFLCGITPTENFDAKENGNSKFVDYKPEVVKPLWHNNLKVLFVTNGTSKIHFYTEKDHSFVCGMEDAPITPFTSDMSASGDAIVAAFMRMLSIQPHLATDKGYLQHIIKYACNCGVIEQWIVGRVHGFPPKEGVLPNGEKSITEREWRTIGPVSS
ncbi:fructokinase-like 2, chloroplastic [Aristolochia californica]|uniref:fructokinase-like 2, chloroplastic n=1 Tax=Aristolochia californica TaxID=171875 RepID=UPI0035D9F016